MSKPKGLDLGTSRIVLATPNDDESFAYKAQLNAFVALPFSKITERMLAKHGVPHGVEGEQLIAYGDHAADFANMVNGDMRRPMKTGLLNASEPKSLEMIEKALELMVGKADRGGKICFSTPAAPPTNEDDLIYHENTVRQMLEKLGYEVKSLNEGLAVVYAELEDDNFTGIGVSFGGGMCNVCISYLGMPAISFSTVRAGDYIDHSAASVSGETPATVRLRKENGFSLNGLSDSSVDQALSVYYSDVIETMVDGLEKALSAGRKLPNLERPAPLVVAGGTTLAGSFRDELDKALRKRKLPIEIGKVRMASDPLNTTAKGALIAAMLEM